MASLIYNSAIDDMARGSTDLTVGNGGNAIVLMYR
jgi:hypothetical protein